MGVGSVWGRSIRVNVSIGIYFPLGRLELRVTPLPEIWVVLSSFRLDYRTVWLFLLVIFVVVVVHWPPPTCGLVDL
jgi:hypothetical protein